ncbi:MAG: hypothetical protein ACI4SM_04730 [Candidatus Gastranaerophilaceae bacterium]
MNKKKEIIENALLSGKSIDELIKIKMKEEMTAVFEKIAQTKEKIRIFDIKDCEKNQIFSKNSIFKKFNKNNNTISYINGIQAEALLGLDDISRNKILNGEIDVFSTENAFVKFEYFETTR